jgi:hypothetical protein
MLCSNQKIPRAFRQPPILPALAVGMLAALLLVSERALATHGEREKPAFRQASILLYHRFGPVVKDPMTVQTVTFRAQLDYLKQHGYVIIPPPSAGVAPPGPRASATGSRRGHYR